MNDHLTIFFRHPVPPPPPPQGQWCNNCSLHHQIRHHFLPPPSPLPSPYHPPLTPIPPPAPYPQHLLLLLFLLICLRFLIPTSYHLPPSLPFTYLPTYPLPLVLLSPPITSHSPSPLLLVFLYLLLLFLLPILPQTSSSCSFIQLPPPPRPSFQIYNVIVETNDGPLTNWSLIIASYVCSLRTHLSQIVTHPFPLPGPRRGSRRLVGLKLKSVWFCVVATHNNRLKRNSNDFGRIFRKMQQCALWMNAEVKYFLKSSSNKM